VSTEHNTLAAAKADAALRTHAEHAELYSTQCYASYCVTTELDPYGNLAHDPWISIEIKYYCDPGLTVRGHLCLTQEESERPDPDRNKRPGPCDLVGNPCDIRTGGKYETADDFVASGASPLRFTRTYNSALQEFGMWKGALGTIWSHGYERRLEFLSDDENAIHYNNQGIEGYVFSGFENIYTSEYYVDAGRSVEKQPDGTFLYTDASGNKEWFAKPNPSSKIARLVRMRSASGQDQVLAYNADGTLDKVTDAFGNFLKFHYDDDRRLTGLDTPSG
jgi:YD repeat-containing protein